MKQILQDIKVTYDEPIPIKCDNINFIRISKNLVLHSKNIYILIKYHFIREQVANPIVKLNYISTKE